MYETCPSGNVYEYNAYALGDRCQSAKTYLEKEFESFQSEPREALILHAVRALGKSISTKTGSIESSQLTVENCSIAIVGRDEDFHELSDSEKFEILASVNDVSPMDTSA